jgi:Nif-specific regulatory protein
VTETSAASFDTSRHLMDSAARLSLKNRVLERLLCLFSGPLVAQRLFDDLLDISMEAIPSEASSLFLKGPKGELTIVAARGTVSSALKGLKLRKGQGLGGASLQDRRLIAVSDVANDPRHAASFARALGFETRSLVAAPVLHDGKALGVIELVNKIGSNDFQRHELELVERISRTAGDLLVRLEEPPRGKRR